MYDKKKNVLQKDNTGYSTHYYQHNAKVEHKNEYLSLHFSRSRYNVIMLARWTTKTHQT